MIRNSVLFPDCPGPRITTNSLGFTSTLTSSSTCTRCVPFWMNTFDMFRHSILFCVLVSTAVDPFIGLRLRRGSGQGSFALPGAQVFFQVGDDQGRGPG